VKNAVYSEPSSYFPKEIWKEVFGVTIEEKEEVPVKRPFCKGGFAHGGEKEGNGEEA
jgi:hypothetical protein